MSQEFFNQEDDIKEKNFDEIENILEKREQDKYRIIDRLNYELKKIVLCEDCKRKRIEKLIN